MKAINIIFDGPPSVESGRFVEVETDSGEGIRVGKWIEKEGGLWALRIELDKETRATTVREIAEAFCSVYFFARQIRALLNKDKRSLWSVWAAMIRAAKKNKPKDVESALWSLLGKEGGE